MLASILAGMVSRKRHISIVLILVAIILGLSLLLLFSFLEKVNYKKQIDNQSINTATGTEAFLREEEVVIIEPEENSTSTEAVILPVEKVLFEYVEVVDSCGPHYEGECLNVRSGPGHEYDVVSHLREGIVLKVGGKVEREDEVWYKIIFDEWLRYPERITSDWYVAAPYVEVLLDEGDKTVWEDGSTTTDKRIVVDRSAQNLKAYDGEELFMDIPISTGLELTPTPRGTFTVFKKTPSRYMQGPLPNLIDQQVYDLPGVPWNLYFTHGGAVIHGAYWHNSFGSQYSHGCVNLSPDNARKLYNWATLGTTVIVRD